MQPAVNSGYVITCALGSQNHPFPASTQPGQLARSPCRGSPEGILLDGDPEVLANVVDGAHAACAGTPLQKGSHHVQHNNGVKDLQVGRMLMNTSAVWYYSILRITQY